MVASTRFAASLAVVVLTGCYDLERLDPGPKSPRLVIDDFEDGNLSPEVPGFGTWRVYPFKWEPDPDRPEDDPRLEFVTGLDGGLALAGEFTFKYPGSEVYTGFSIGTAGDPRNPYDVRGYRAMHLTTRFEQGVPPLPGTARIYVQIGCDSAPPLGDVTGPFFVNSFMDFNSDWHTLELDYFSELISEPKRIDGDASACLAVVDSIRFTVSTTVAPGARAQGTFHIDDVYFE